ncbi:MAG: T9SS type A sorting domain-containing protein, partial [Bacteroidota bacterium]
PTCSITGNNFCSGGSSQLCAPAGMSNYTWSNGAHTQCITVTAAGTYSVTVTNASGCTSSCSKCITVSAPPTCSITGTSAICSGGSSQLCAPSGMSYYTWSNGAHTQCITATSAGTYTVTVTNASGCTSSCSKCITVSAHPTCTITGCGSSICQGQSAQLCAPAGMSSYTWSTGAHTQCITVSAVGCYTVTVTNSGGCTSSCSKSIAVSTLPTCTITGNSSFCSGSSTQLCAPAGMASYHWSNGATTQCITVTSAGTYTATITNSGGCSSICSKCITTTAHPVCAVTGNLVICNGQTTQLCATGGYSNYHWSTGATTQCITVATAGTYTVTVTNSGGCTSACSACVTHTAAREIQPVGPTTTTISGIESSVYPNPFVTTTTIEFQSAASSTRGLVQIYSMDGALVATVFDGEVEAGKIYLVKWNAQVAEGLYLYRITCGDEVKTGRLSLVTE